MHIRFVLLIFIIAVSPISMKTSFAADEWVADEIFKQIADLRRDNNLLRKELDSVKEQLARIGRQGSGNNKISEISLDDDFRLGNENENAKVAIVEFSDFECPFCKRHNDQTLSRLKKDYIDTGKIQYVMRDYPLDFHRNAKSAAIAANCAGEQNAYWEMHHALFNAKSAKGQKLYEQLAENLNLNKTEFNSCLKDENQAKEVEIDLAYGSKVGVRGTPAFFIGKLEGDKIVNAQFLSGAQPYAKFKKIIDTILN